eukprot:Skav212059  [mRNA]  locus=scaffold408:153953:155749:+ [translate_table: standard]
MINLINPSYLGTFETPITESPQGDLTGELLRAPAGELSDELADKADKGQEAMKSNQTEPLEAHEEAPIGHGTGAMPMGSVKIPGHMMPGEGRGNASEEAPFWTQNGQPSGALQRLGNKADEL